MIQLKKELKIKNKGLKNLENCHLSIQFSLDGFSFCVLNKMTQRFEALCEYRFNEVNNNPQKLLTNIKSVYQKQDLLEKTFSSVNVIHVNDLACLVPKVLFDENFTSEYVSYNNKVFKHDYVVSDEIKNHDIISVFIPFVNVNNFLIDQYGGFEYKHHATVLVEKLLGIYKFSLVPHVFVHLRENHFEMIVIADKKLQLYNTFKHTSKEDFIYYILFTVEQLKLNPEKFELVLFGSITKEDEYFSIAYKYIRNVSLLENRSKYEFDPMFTEEDKRNYFSLLNQY
ncbi:DUF3822 family protein [Flavobacteriaceae bacterium F08102]|nr:DUF3822 family protein [Flavobacteriaceae bacterium F08102]